MDELEERISVLHDAGFIDESGVADLRAIVKILIEDNGFPKSDELMGPFVTHVAAAMKRARDGEAIEPLPDIVVDQIRASASGSKAKEIQQTLLRAMKHELSQDEQDFVLVHVSGMLEAIGQ